MWDRKAASPATKGLYIVPPGGQTVELQADEKSSDPDR